MSDDESRAAEERKRKLQALAAKRAQDQGPKESSSSIQSKPSSVPPKKVSEKDINRREAEYEKKAKEEFKGKNLDSYKEDDGFIVDSDEEDFASLSEESEEVLNSSEISDSEEDSPPKKSKKKRQASSSSDDSVSDDGDSDDEKPKKKLKFDSGDESLDTSAIITTGRRTRGKQIDFKNVPGFETIGDSDDD